jgi:hypothetical protein
LHRCLGEPPPPLEVVDHLVRAAMIAGYGTPVPG